MIFQEGKPQIIKPMYGKKYLLYLGRRESANGFYIGINHLTDDPNKPEGHTFVEYQFIGGRLLDIFYDKHLHFYCTRDNNPILEDVLLLTGFNAPTFVGIKVDKVNCEVTSSEESFLISKIKEWEKNLK